MALPVASADLDSILKPIRSQVVDSVKVLFSRLGTSSGDSADFEITDDKEDLPASGPLQDCEFGMIMLMVWTWLDKDFFVRTEIAPERFQKVILNIVKRTVRRLIERETGDEGGGDNYPVFFNGAPYTLYNRKMYSANLDAAMIAVAFLIQALKKYNYELAHEDHELELAKDPRLKWIAKLREAALYVVDQGVHYALDCRVFLPAEAGQNDAPGTVFSGFTCDPQNAQAAEGVLLSDFDRLFFTWTACETIHDLVSWRESYQRDVGFRTLPQSLSAELIENIGKLHAALDAAAKWCRRFLEDFKTLSIDENKITALVQTINKYGKRAVTKEQDKKDIRELTDLVLNVYHISQYAAIRSLGPPGTISLPEAEVIAEKLKQLVLYGILSTELDIAEQRDLYESLTRRYKLGRTGEYYSDDAWYPLVVRSLSGLLARTLDDLENTSDRIQVNDLVRAYEQILEVHVRNLSKRRPSGIEQEPELIKLWSFAEKKPYVLYATQRTIFALMEYASFIEKVSHFNAYRPVAPKREEELADLLARQFSELIIGPEIRQWLAKLPSSSTPPRASMITGNGVLLPSTVWAADLIRGWIDSFSRDFDQEGIEDQIKKRAGTLHLVLDVARLPEKDYFYPKVSKAKNNAFEGCRRIVEEIRGCGPTGEALAKLDQWDNENVREILLAHLFGEYIKRRPSSLIELFEDSAPDCLWKLLQRASSNEDSFRKIEK